MPPTGQPSTSEPVECSLGSRWEKIRIAGVRIHLTGHDPKIIGPTQTPAGMDHAKNEPLPRQHGRCSTNQQFAAFRHQHRCPYISHVRHLTDDALRVVTDISQLVDADATGGNFSGRSQYGDLAGTTDLCKPCPSARPDGHGLGPTSTGGGNENDVESALRFARPLPEAQSATI